MSGCQGRPLRRRNPRRGELLGDPPAPPAAVDVPVEHQPDDLGLGRVDVKVFGQRVVGRRPQPRGRRVQSARLQLQPAAGLTRVPERWGAADVPPLAGQFPLRVPDPVGNLVLLELGDRRPDGRREPVGRRPGGQHPGQGMDDHAVGLAQLDQLYPQDDVAGQPIDVPDDEVGHPPAADLGGQLGEGPAALERDVPADRLGLLVDPRGGQAGPAGVLLDPGPLGGG